MTISLGAAMFIAAGIYLVAFLLGSGMYSRRHRATKQQLQARDMELAEVSSELDQAILQRDTLTNQIDELTGFAAAGVEWASASHERAELFDAMMAESLRCIRIGNPGPMVSAMADYRLASQRYESAIIAMSTEGYAVLDRIKGQPVALLEKEAARQRALIPEKVNVYQGSRQRLLDTE